MDEHNTNDEVSKCAVNRANSNEELTYDYFNNLTYRLVYAMTYSAEVPSTLVSVRCSHIQFQRLVHAYILYNALFRMSTSFWKIFYF